MPSKGCTIHAAALPSKKATKRHHSSTAGSSTSQKAATASTNSHGEQNQRQPALRRRAASAVHARRSSTHRPWRSHHGPHARRRHRRHGRARSQPGPRGTRRAFRAAPPRRGHADFTGGFRSFYDRSHCVALLRGFSGCSQRHWAGPDSSSSSRRATAAKTAPAISRKTTPWPFLNPPRAGTAFKIDVY